MKLADRIAQLEARMRRADNLPVVLEDCGRLARIPGQWTILRTGDGARWSQLEGEAMEAFKARAAAAAAGVVAAVDELAGRLVMVRPRLSLEGWKGLHGL